MAKFKPYLTEQGEFIPTYLSEWVPENHLARFVSDFVEEVLQPWGRRLSPCSTIEIVV
ncbi:hypothetical protein [Paenibacillus sp. A3]|uniref:hypothetical protein n=1 Tax=Paenibacillus sp. A3 TaxID=1337054 RepID=UPI000A537875|nr:hypothetical protein [Paenibacillus sp. A3]